MILNQAKINSRTEFKSLKKNFNRLETKMDKGFQRMDAGFADVAKGFQTMLDMFGKVFKKIDDLNGIKDNHETRITKLEKEVFPQI